MLKMPDIEYIKERYNNGDAIAAIARDSGHSEKTIRKYGEMTDFSPTLPERQTRPSILDPYKETVEKWLREDETRSRKQRHTAMRVWERLQEEYGFAGSYPTVQKYVKRVREKLKAEKKKTAQGFLELTWPAGSAQVDFGHAQFVTDGQAQTLPYLCVDFPYSNTSFVQVFRGETAECVCQGLQDIFAHIGGVPPRIVFDNATGIGKRMGRIVHESELFRRFRLQYGFVAVFCNPYSGHEKGGVERSVHHTRQHLFVPPRAFEDIEAENAKLLEDIAKCNDRVHYRKGVPQTELFGDDRRALLALPPGPFDACRIEKRKTDGYGKVQVDGSHFYLVRPDLRFTEVLVKIAAHTIEVFTMDGTSLCTHRRMFGSARTDSSDPAALLELLAAKPGAWKHSSVRAAVPDNVAAYLDALRPQDRRQPLHILSSAAESYGFHAACAAFSELVGRNAVHEADAHVLAARIAGYGLDTAPESGPPLAVYDTLLPGGKPL